MARNRPGSLVRHAAPKQRKPRRYPIHKSLPALLTVGSATMRPSPVMRIAVLLACGILLTACSGSNRVEDIVPAWANTSPRSATRYVAQKKHLEERSTPDAKPQTPQTAGPQEAEKPAARSFHEE